MTKYEMFRIYVLVNPITHNVFYVGRTSLPLEMRLDRHMSPRPSLGKRVYDCMSLFRVANIKPVIIEIDKCRCSISSYKESLWIEVMLGFGFQLINTIKKKIKNNQMSSQIMNIKQYADKRGVSTAAVRRALIDNKTLVGVQFAQKVGRDWVLTVCNPVSKKNIGTCIVTHT